MDNSIIYQLDPIWPFHPIKNLQKSTQMALSAKAAERPRAARVAADNVWQNCHISKSNFDQIAFTKKPI